jgi:hypothetical protein
VCPASTILFPSVLCFCRAKCLIHIVLIWGCIPFLLHQIFLRGAEIADAPPKKVVIAKVWLQLCSFFLYQNWIAHLFLFAGLFGCVDIVSSKIIVDQNVILVYQRAQFTIFWDCIIWRWNFVKWWRILFCSTLWSKWQKYFAHASCLLPLHVS